jgi:hypothetical protein
MVDDESNRLSPLVALVNRLRYKVAALQDAARRLRVKSLDTIDPGDRAVQARGSEQGGLGGATAAKTRPLCLDGGASGGQDALFRTEGGCKGRAEGDGRATGGRGPSASPGKCRGNQVLVMLAK